MGIGYGHQAATTREVGLRTPTQNHEQRLLKSLLTVALILLAARTVIALLHGMDTTGDSGRYRASLTGQSIFDLLGWWNGRSPGFAAQLLNLLPAPLTAAIQAAFAGTAWGFAALTSAAAFRSRIGMITSFALVSLLGISPWVQSYDSTILTESLIISGSVMALAAAFLLCSPRMRQMWSIHRLTQPRSNRMSLLALLIGTTVPICAKASLWFFVIPIALLAIWLAVPLSLVVLQRRTAVKATAYLLIIGVTALTFSLLQSNAEATWYAQNRMAARGTPDYIALAKEHGMPTCPELDNYLANTEPTLDRVDGLREIDCPGLTEWWASGGVTPQAAVLSIPGTTLRLYLDDIRRQWTPDLGEWTVWSQWTDTRPTAANAVNRWKKSASLSSRDVLIVGLFAAAVLALRTRRLPPGAKRFVNAPLALMAGIIGIGGVYTVITWLQDAMEPSRHAIPFTILAILIVGFGISAALAGKHDGVQDLAADSNEQLSDPAPDADQAIGTLPESH